MDSKDNSLGISWHDSAWIPNLNPATIMDYFSERSNPFYDRTCNNEIVKMQRLNVDQLNNMTGLEYILLHCQEPILYVVRKQHRHSPTQVTPLADYYIIAGVVYQSPDLGSVINSRALSVIHHVQTAFENTLSYSRYHPSKGYWWDFSDIEGAESSKKTKDKTKEEPSSLFQRQRVDILLGELAKKYPPKFPPVHVAPPIAAVAAAPTTSQPATTQPNETKPNATPPEEVSKAVEVAKEANASEKPPDSQTTNGGSTTLSAKQTKNQPPAEKRPRL